MKYSVLEDRGGKKIPNSGMPEIHSCRKVLRFFLLISFQDDLYPLSFITELHSNLKPVDVQTSILADYCSPLSKQVSFPSECLVFVITLLKENELHRKVSSCN